MASDDLTPAEGNGSAPAVPTRATTTPREDRGAVDFDDTTNTDLNLLAADEQDLVSVCNAELAGDPEPARAARLHVEIARIRENAGDLPTAAHHYELALQFQADHAPALAGARRIYLRTGRYEAALPVFDAEAHQSPNAKRKAALYFEKGRVYEDRLGDIASALAAYRRALELDPQNPSVLKALERSHASHQQSGELAATLERTANAITEDPEHRAAILVKRARLVLAAGDDEAAAEICETALTLDPHAHGALDALEEIYARSEQWQRLVTTLERAAGNSRDHALRASLLYRVAHIHAERMGNQNEAIDALARAARAAPRERLILEDLAHHYGDKEMFVSLLNVQRALIDAASDEGERVALLHTTGAMYDLLGRDEEAIRYLRAALELTPAHIPTLNALGKIYERLGEWQELIAIYSGEAGTTSNPDRAAAAHARIAETFEIRLSRTQEAVEHHVRALSLVPDFEPSFKSLTRIYAATGQHKQLARLYERNADRSNDDSRTVAYLSKAGALWEDRLGDPEQAAHAYTRILELEPANLHAIHGLQRVLERSQSWKRLVETLELEAELANTDEIRVGLLYRAGTILDEYLEDSDAARDRYTSALALSPNHAPTLTSLGKLYYRTGRWEELLDIYQRQLDTADTDTANAALLSKMGELCEKQLADDDRALAFYRKAAEIDRRCRPAIQALVRMLRSLADWPGLASALELELEGLEDPPVRTVALIRLGQVYEDHLGNDKRAIHFYKLALEENPQARTAAIALARLYSKNREFSSLAQEVEREIPATTDQNRAVSMLLRQGELWRDHLNDETTAARYFQAASEYDGGRLPALLALEDIYSRNGSWHELTEVYAELAQVLTDEGARIAALRELARTQELHRIGSVAHLVGTYRSILGHEPGDEASLIALERLARDTADTELLCEVYRLLAENANDSTTAADYYTRLGAVLERKHLIAATEAYREALNRDPQTFGAIRGLARMAEYQGDAQTMAEAARREAALSPDNQRAAMLWTRSAALRMENHIEIDGAIDDLEEALECWPDSEEAAARLVEPLLSGGQVERLINTLSRAARSAHEPRRLVSLWMEVAELYANQQGDIGSAIAALQRALEVEPKSVTVLRGLGALYSAGEQWGAAVDQLERALKLADEKEIVHQIHLDIADIRGTKLNDDDAAEEHIRSVLKRDEHSTDALERLTDCQFRQGLGKAAAATARKLVKASRTPQERSHALVKLARVERSMSHATAAEDALAEALSIEGPIGPAAELFRDMVSQHGSWVRYAAGLAAHIKRARNGEVPFASGRGPVLAYKGLADAYADGMGLPNKAIEALEDGVQHTSGDPDLRYELALRLRMGREYEKSIAQFHSLLAASRTRVELWEELAKTLEDADRPAEAILARAPLEVLGHHSSSHAAVTRRVRPANAPPGTLDGSAMASISVKGAIAAVATDLLYTIADAVGRLSSADLSKLGVGRENRVDTRPDHPLYPITTRVFDIFGAPCEVYEHSGTTPIVSVEMTEPTAVIVSESMRSMPAAQQAFFLGFAVAQVATRTFPAAKVSTEQLHLLLAAAARITSPDFTGGLSDEDVLETLCGRLRRAVPRRWRRQLDVAATEYATAPPTDIGAWQKALHQTAVRAGALVADDLAASVQALQRLEGITDLEGAALVHASPAVADLLHFWISEPALRVRHAAGLL